MIPIAPDYSIIIPTYRRREQLARCLAAIEALEFPRDRFELVVVDDGSPTPPGDLVAALDPGISAQLISARHSGPGVARNVGASLARGRYLVFTDDDCTPRADWLAAVDRWTRATSVPSAIGGRTVNILANDIYATASQGILDYLYEYYGHHNDAVRFFTTNNLVVPRAEFLEVGGFDDQFERAAAEDRDLCERWRRHGLPLQYANDMVVSHAHALTFGQFNRLHFRYGRGAFDLHRSRARRGQRALRLEPLRFYYGLISYPLRRSGGRRGVALVFLHFWSQVAHAAGYFFERLRRGWVVDAGEPRHAADYPRVVARSDVGSEPRGSMSEVP
jgi:glycosyltransferase involved in cell wall biosynthesis